MTNVDRQTTEGTVKVKDLDGNRKARKHNTIRQPDGAPLATCWGLPQYWTTGLKVPSTEQQLYQAIAVLMAVEHELKYLCNKIPRDSGPLFVHPVILQPKEVAYLANLWGFVQCSTQELVEFNLWESVLGPTTQCVELDLRRRWAQAVSLLMSNRDLHVVDGVLAEVIDSMYGPCSADPVFWHSLVKELKELAAESFDSNGRNE